MTALSTIPPSAPQAKSGAVSAAALLGAATKKPAKGNGHLVYAGDAGRDAAARWLQLHAQFEETERELGLARDQVLDVVRPWHEDACARRRAHEPTVVVETNAGAVRVSFQHRYTKLPVEREAELRQVLGDRYEGFFKRSVSLKIKKEIAEDPTALEQLVVALAESIGADNFASLFEVEQTLIPTKAFTETNCQLPAETRAALAAAGVKQIVAMAAK
jgi:hypothetical protein